MHLTTSTTEPTDSNSNVSLCGSANKNFKSAITQTLKSSYNNDVHELTQSKPCSSNNLSQETLNDKPTSEILPATASAFHDSVKKSTPVPPTLYISKITHFIDNIKKSPVEELQSNLESHLQQENKVKSSVFKFFKIFFRIKITILKYNICLQ